MSFTVYVSAKISTDGNFADCKYYQDQAGTNEIPGSTIHIATDAGACTFAPCETTELMLIGATFKTIGSPTSMNNSNFTAADDENVLSFTMPTTGAPITKGVVLLFSTPGTVENLYPSSDPQVINDMPTCK